MFEYSDEYISQLLRDIYSGLINPENLPEDLYMSIARYLMKGVSDGFAGASAMNVTFGGPDKELLAELTDNIYIFSAAKTFQQTLEMSSLLTGEKGLTTFSDFEKKAREIFTTYNSNYLSAEYETAVIQAGNAAKWNTIEKQKTILPMLRYISVHDALVCPICDALDKITLPVDDPFWKTHYPSNHFRCRCIVEQLDGGEATSKSVVKEAVKSSAVTDEFLYNPGIKREVFSASGKSQHPYFVVPKKYEYLARNNFNLPMP